MIRPLVLLAGLLLIAMPASASHWETDWTDPDDDLGDSGCEYAQYDCGLDYLCTGGSPPAQVVDLAMHCALRASGEAEDVVIGFAHLAYAFADFGTSFAEETPAVAHGAAQGSVDLVHGQLCDVVWSGFCGIPMEIPQHIPVDDPIQEYPL